MSHLNTPSALRDALARKHPVGASDLEVERLDTALRLVLNALDDDTHTSVVTINRSTLCRDIATVLRLGTPEVDRGGGQ